MSIELCLIQNPKNVLFVEDSSSRSWSLEFQPLSLVIIYYSLMGQFALPFSLCDKFQQIYGRYSILINTLFYSKVAGNYWQLTTDNWQACHFYEICYPIFHSYSHVHPLNNRHTSSCLQTENLLLWQIVRTCIKSSSKPQSNRGLVVVF